ncbi:MAG: hypothetical protein M3Q16_10675 [Pseudomonadota bacterium]|nr:hypothetical protein [Pseudomonadota bacterium]
MIRLLFDTTIAGVRQPAGSILNLEPTIEVGYIAKGDADRNALPQLIGQSYAGWTRSSANSVEDASLVTLTTVTVPAGTMGLNSKLVIIVDWDYPNSASAKTLAVDLGGSNISAIQQTTGNVAAKILLEVQNLNNLASQKTINGSSFGVQPNARIATTEDTAFNVPIDFRCKWAAAVTSESIKLLGYSIWHYPGSS